MGWFYMVIWLGIGLCVNLVVSPPMLVKVSINVILLILTPSLTDLFESYDGYLKDRAKTKSGNTSPEHPDHADTAHHD